MGWSDSLWWLYFQAQVVVANMNQHKLQTQKEREEWCESVCCFGSEFFCLHLRSNIFIYFHQS